MLDRACLEFSGLFLFYFFFSYQISYLYSVKYCLRHIKWFFFYFFSFQSMLCLVFSKILKHWKKKISLKCDRFNIRFRETKPNQTKKNWFKVEKSISIKAISPMEKLPLIKMINRWFFFCEVAEERNSKKRMK